MSRRKDRWTIRLVGVPDAGYSCRIVNPWEGFYLQRYDPDGREGLGEAVFTGGVEDALTFPSFDEAKAFWFAQSTVLPSRAINGAEVENRPLAVCDVAIDTV